MQAWSDVAFRSVLPVFPEPYNAHLFGVILLNCLVLAAVTQVVRHDTGSDVAAIAFTFVAVLFYGSIRGAFTSSWMPDVYLGPFLLYLVASVSVLAGRVRSLPYFVVACGLLVHGHVSFVPFAVVMTGIVAARLGYRHRGHVRELVRAERRTFVASGLWLGLFVLPIAVNLLVHWPGEIPDYWRFAVTDRQQNHHGLRESLRFVASYWPASGAAAVLIALGAVAALVVTARHHPVAALRRTAAATLVVVLVATLLFVQYASVGVDYLSFRYVGYFSVMIPALLLGEVLVAAIHDGAARDPARGATRRDRRGRAGGGRRRRAGGLDVEGVREPVPRRSPPARDRRGPAGRRPARRPRARRAVPGRRLADRAGRRAVRPPPRARRLRRQRLLRVHGHRGPAVRDARSGDAVADHGGAHAGDADR